METSAANLITNSSSNNLLTGSTSLIAGGDLFNSNSNSLDTGISFGSNSSSMPLSDGGNLVTDNSNTYTGAPTNAFVDGGGSVAFAGLGNVVIGNGKWQISDTSDKEAFASAYSLSTDELLTTIMNRLRDRLPASDISNNSSDSNPFANGNNPFGAGSLPSTPALDSLNSVNGSNPFASGDTSTTGSNPFASGDTSTTGSNPFAGGDTSTIGSNPFAGGDASTSGSNPFAGGDTSTVSNPFAGGDTSTGSNPFAGGNPFTSGSNPFAGGDASTGTNGAGQTPSFNILNLVFGGDSNLPFSTDTQSTGSSTPTTAETLQNVQLKISDFASVINSDTNNIFDAGNPTPLKTPSALLNLFKADMFSFNNGVNQANSNGSMITDSNNPFAAIAGDKPIPYDIVKVALGGILPFSGSDNIFNTNDGQLPIGYGNHDLGTGNATIGNANWDYGSANASIGNANWNWDSSYDNATIGNGNWNWDSSHDNTTIGNGNWNWDSTSANKTLGNGNWEFGNNNTTLGNSNWDFGTNNIVIGSGNHVFTNNSIVIGDGNWSVVIDNNSTDGMNVLANLDTLEQVMGVKGALDNMIGSAMGKMGQVFKDLGNFSESGSQTFDRLILSQGTNTSNNSGPCASLNS